MKIKGMIKGVPLITETGTIDVYEMDDNTVWISLEQIKALLIETNLEHCIQLALDLDDLLSFSNKVMLDDIILVRARDVSLIISALSAEETIVH